MALETSFQIEEVTSRYAPRDQYSLNVISMPNKDKMHNPAQAT
ncbi:hypothetical protein ACU8KH_04540 [Lachancea thermotolerans]